MSMRWRYWCLYLSGLTAVWSRGALGAETPVGTAIPNNNASVQPARPEPETASPQSLPNLKTQTLGGVQFWGDVHFFRGWHIQQNIFTKHYRLLDEHNVRHAWGSYEACLAKLREIRESHNLTPPDGPVVVLLHGMGRSDRAVKNLRQWLENAGYHVIAMNYPSIRAELRDNGRYLRRVLESLEGEGPVHLVGHSMGGLVIRTCLAEYQPERLGRVVMLGTPNQGAGLATFFKDWWLAKLLTGPAARELSTAPHGVAPQLPAPACEFGIIAGGSGTEDGYLPFVSGDDDGLVEVEHTKLHGAHDFLVVPHWHNYLLHSPTVFEATERFLAKGHFRHTGERSPLPNPEKALSNTEMTSKATTVTTSQ